MHPLCGAQPVRVTRGAMVAQRYSYAHILVTVFTDVGLLGFKSMVNKLLA